ncbi:MAG: TIGR02757 family protein [Rhodothermales bacterium]
MPFDEATHRYLDRLVEHFERPTFIDTDPISIPHGFDDPRDREVIGLFAALLAWGRRETVLMKMAELCERMSYRPYAFVRKFDPERDASALEGFKHRTFQPQDAFWLTHNLGRLLRAHETVEEIFVRHLPLGAEHVGPAIQGFSESIMSADDRTPSRLRKHLARPEAGSACKRLNMYLRWMVRPGPVDLGVWKRIATYQLMLPVDVHAGRQAREMGLLKRRSNDWKACLELTENCRKLDASDPARYDFAFFGVGVHGEPELTS